MKMGFILAGAGRAIVVHASRSVLTSLGISIAVTAVIMMVAVGNGARMEIEHGISTLGSNVIHVMPGAQNVNARSEGSGTGRSFTEEDLDDIRKSVPDVVAASGSVVTTGRMFYRNGNWKTVIEGVRSEFLSVRDWPLSRGRSFSGEDETKAHRKVILGATVARTLFGKSEPIGELVRIERALFEVVGVLDTKGFSSSGRDLDDVVLVPMRTVQRHLHTSKHMSARAAGHLLFKVRSGADMVRVKSTIEQQLKSRRGARATGDDDFIVRDLTEFLKAKSQTQDTLGILLGATAVITLVVGGIGIMNMMLVAVTERSSEIGLRMAIGATPTDIKFQFLTEAVMLGAIGSVLGLGLGYFGTLMFNEWLDWPVKISTDIVAIAIMSALATALAFGYLPASRASKLAPVVAMNGAP